MDIKFPPKNKPTRHICTSKNVRFSRVFNAARVPQNHPKM